MTEQTEQVQPQNQPERPSDLLFGLAQEVQSLRQAETALIKIVEILKIQPNEEGNVSFDSIIEVVEKLSA